jgi:hypothetical protein
LNPLLQTNQRLLGESATSFLFFSSWRCSRTHKLFLFRDLQVFGDGSPFLSVGRSTGGGERARKGQGQTLKKARCFARRTAARCIYVRFTGSLSSYIFPRRYSTFSKN